VRTLYYTPEWNLIRSQNPDGESLEYFPPLKCFEFPLKPGKNWQQIRIETNSKTGVQHTHPLNGSVGDWEMLTVPSGTFKAIKIIAKTEVLDETTGQKTLGNDIFLLGMFPKYVKALNRKHPQLSPMESGQANNSFT